MTPKSEISRELGSMVPRIKITHLRQNFVVERSLKTRPNVTPFTRASSCHLFYLLVRQSVIVPISGMSLTTIATKRQHDFSFVNDKMCDVYYL